MDIFINYEGEEKMKNQWKKKIMLCVGGLALASSGATTATTYTTPMLSGAQIFSDGDEVLINGSNQFGIRLVNTGDTMTTTGKLKFDFTTTLRPTSTIEAISLKNGGMNTLGTGSEITVITANTVNYPAYAIPANAIVVGKQSGGAVTSLAGSDLNVTISGQGGQRGIQGQGNVNLGSNSKITATSTASTANGINLGGSTLQAENVTVNATGQTSATGLALFQTNTTFTGQNNSITAKSNGSSVTGIQVNGGTSGPSNLTFERVDINVEAASLGDAQGIFSYMKDSHVDLGSGSTIKTKNALGVVLSATAQDPNPVNSTFTADKLTLTTEGTGAHGIQSMFGSTMTLTDSEVTTNGTNAHALILAGGATNNITGSEINAKGAEAYGVYITEIGTPNKAPSVLNLIDTQVTSTNHGIYVRSSTMTDKNQGVGAITINAKYSDIKSTDGYGIRALGSETTMNLDHSTLAGATDGTAVRFEAKIAGDKMDVNLTNQSVITGDISSVGVAGITNALAVNAKQSKVLGDAIATAGSTINAKFEDNSYWQGKGEYLATGDALNVELGDSTWDMTADSRLSSLTLNNSNVNFVSDITGGTFETLEVNDLSGNGTFAMRTDIAALQGDLLSVTGTSAGSHGLHIPNQGSAGVDPTQELNVVQTADGVAAFALKNNVEVGGYQYGLHRDGVNSNNWNLYSTGKATPAANAVISIANGAYLLNYAETQTLMQRMGDLRQSESQGNIWARAYGGKFESSSDSFLSGFDMTYSGMQVGGDKKITLKDGKGDLYLGGMFGYSKGDQSYETGHGSVDSKSLGVYGTYIAPSGFYADAIVKYGWMKNDYKVLDTAGGLVTGDDINTSGLSASLELGQRIHFNKQSKQGWYVEPQAQISFGHQSGGSFTASNGLNVDVESYNSVLGRVGLLAGYEIKGGKNPVNIYGKVSYVHEFDGDMGVRMNGIGANQSFGDSWITYGVGVTAQIAKKHNVYLDIERASGGQFDQPWAINGGYRFSW